MQTRVVAPQAAAHSAAPVQPSRSTIRRTGLLLNALDAGQQLRLAGEAAASLVVHLGEDLADRHGGPRVMRLIDHLHLAAAIAFDAQEP